MTEKTKPAKGAPKKTHAQRHEVLAMIRFNKAQNEYLLAQNESRSVYMRRLLDADMRKSK